MASNGSEVWQMQQPTDRKHRIHLTKEKETLLITLYAKALDNRSQHPILGDKAADELVDMIDYDFEKFKGFGNDNITVLRAKQYDDWLRAFIADHHDAVVVYLGCGLDTRIMRIDPPPEVSWYDLDYPDVIALREQFFAPRPGYSMIASSVTSLEWLATLPVDRPVMIVAEGLFEYLTEAQVQTLLNALTGHFEHGDLAFDVLSSFAVRSGKSQLEATTGAEHTWAVDDTSTIERLDSRLTKTADLSVFKLASVKKLPLLFRVLFSSASLLPQFRNMLRLLRYQF
jgi:O-methyltransferase involved in polyketide biosynthesis